MDGSVVVVPKFHSIHAIPSMFHSNNECVTFSVHNFMFGFTSSIVSFVSLFFDVSIDYHHCYCLREDRNCFYDCSGKGIAIVTVVNG